MTELAEGARLEIVCTLTGTVGSNPTLSARVYYDSRVLRNVYCEFRQAWKGAAVAIPLCDAGFLAITKILSVPSEILTHLFPTGMFIPSVQTNWTSSPR